MTPSQYQTDIYDAIRSDTDNLQVRGVAGCGKTTTLVESMKSAGGGRKLCLAYNKAIQLELEGRAPWGVEVYTFHKLGKDVMWASYRSKLNTKKGKASKHGALVCKYVPTRHEEDFRHIWRWMDLGKDLGVGFCIDNTEDQWLQVARAMSVPLEQDVLEDIAPLIPRMYEEGLNNTQDISFGDCILLPLVHDLKIPRYHYLWVDEAQDMSIPFQYWARRLLSPSDGRVFIFGDDRQAIYAFRGADAEAMLHFHEMFQTRYMPLSITYRCALSIVELAQQYAPELEAAPDAPLGHVRNWDFMPPLDTYDADCMVLCRNNAPLIRMAFRFLKAGMPFTLTSSFTRSLIDFFKMFKEDDMAKLRKKVDNWYHEAMTEAEEKNHFSTQAMLDDKYDAAIFLLENSNSLQDIARQIRQLSEVMGGPRLSTIHRAKGLEAERVFLLRPDLIPSKWAKYDWEQTQERNLLYVAYTRARTELNILPGGN